MRLSIILVTAAITSFTIIGCSSSKKTTKTEGQEKLTETVESTNEISTGDISAVNTETVSKGNAKEQLLQEAIASYPDSLVIMLQRTPCYGRCPTYTVKIYASGYSTYEGKAHVDMEGNHSTTMSKDDITSIKKMAENVKFFDLNNIYDTNVTDFPTTHLYIQDQGKKKQVLDRQGGPKELKELETFIDELIKTKKWTKI